MRLILFDSFEGLPEMTEVDLDESDFHQGQFSCSLDEVKRNLLASDVDLTKYLFVKGWYKDTCAKATKEIHQIKAAAICWIDCDLYQSTSEVLNFLKDIIVDGTILVFDDWFCFRGSPYRGQQLAFSEFKQKMPGWVFNEFQRETSDRVAFYCNRIPITPLT